MTQRRAFIVAAGTFGPAGRDVAELLESLRSGSRALRPLSLFAVGDGDPRPVGQAPLVQSDPHLPRTHALALAALDQVLPHLQSPPDAVVLGGTTGGVALTEELLKRGESDPRRYRLHGVGTVAEYLAERVGCQGQALTVSTACSSGAVALKVALELIRSGQARTVLAGGVDSLCRLTYHGFNLLQLIDPQGARPLDRQRRGMSVAEAAALLLLQGADQAPAGALAELRGVGLSCDAFHSTKPLPAGEGALQAMERALKDGAAEAGEVDYVNLHGTGTQDNDAAEAAALCTLFRARPPLLSSTKGITGHALAAAGALEALIGALSIQHGLVPANVGLQEKDPALGLDPVREPLAQPVGLVLSNSFGFGGNNASVVMGANDRPHAPRSSAPVALSVLHSACITGAGLTVPSLEAFSSGRSCAGALDSREICRDLPPRKIRRLKRLARLVMAMTQEIQQQQAAQHRGDPEAMPRAVFMGTGWGALSETNDFLAELFLSGETLSSPTDFVGSVHNAPAGQVAIRLSATGANVTATGGDTSFEQALFIASLLASEDDDPLLLLGADEAHPRLSPLLDPSVQADPQSSDGGGALLLRASRSGAGIGLRPVLFRAGAEASPAVHRLEQALGGAERIQRRHGALLVGIPAAQRALGREQLALFLERCWPQDANQPVVDLREALGQYASVSATAAALAVRLCQEGRVPAPLAGIDEVSLEGRGVLLLSLGDPLAAIEIG